MEENSSASASANSLKHSFHGRKLRYQQRIVEHSAFSLPVGTTTTTTTHRTSAAAAPATELTPTSYLTAKRSWKTAASNASTKFSDIKIKQVERENQSFVSSSLNLRQSTVRKWRKTRKINYDKCVDLSRTKGFDLFFIQTERKRWVN